MANRSKINYFLNSLSEPTCEHSDDGCFEKFLIANFSKKEIPMKKLNSILFCAIITPTIALTSGSVLSQQTSDKQNQYDQKSKALKDNKHREMSNTLNRKYLSVLPTNGMHASNLIGMNVKTANNEDIGEVQDLLIDSNGQVAAIVVSVGGFLGIGDKDVAVGWDNVTKSGNNDDGQLRLNVTRENLTSAPKFVKRD
ncbi:hypothetical protein RHSA111115_07145 [Rheinheimera salexigens]